MNTTIFAACSNLREICLDSLPQTSADGSLVQTVLTLAIRIIAVVAVLFVAIGGLRYILSQGEPAAISKAKGTIMYALIGLVIAIIAQGIVILVVKATS